MHIVWQAAKQIWQKMLQLSLKFEVLIGGEIEGDIFLTNAVHRQLFAWRKKLVEIDTCRQFHQC